MKSIHELIAELCPNGVEYKRLEHVGAFTRGSGIQKSDLVESGFPAIHYGEIHTKYGVFTETTVSFIKLESQFNVKIASPGSLIIATTSEDDGGVGKAVAWCGKENVAVSGDAIFFEHNLDPKYISYFFASQQFASLKQQYITGAKIRRIGAKGLGDIRIPVPPLEVQQEIVRILDEFTQLQAALEAELEARRQQYEYYRDQLLTFPEIDGGGIA